jgi:hypothetical protein
MWKLSNNFFIQSGIVAGTVLRNKGGGQAVREFDFGAAGLHNSLDEDLYQDIPRQH